MLTKILLKKRVKANKNDVILKIFKFQKKKWADTIEHYRKLLLPFRYRKYRLVDPNKILISNFRNNFNKYKNKYKESVYLNKKIKYFYFTKTNILKLIKKIDFKTIIKTFEKCIDFILFRSKFCLSVNSARELIKKGCVYINKKKVIKKKYQLKSGDLVNLKVASKEYLLFLVKGLKWPVTNLSLVVNYKTKELVFLENKINTFKTYFSARFKTHTIN